MRDYLRYYRRPTRMAPFVFMRDAVTAGNRARSASLLNRARDYLDLLRGTGSWELHRELNEVLFDAAANWPSYDYGEGYFYQSYARAGIRGLRNTEARVEAMRLGERVAGKTVLEVGCNSGFLGLTLAATAAHVTGVEINPYLVKQARLVASSLGTANVSFQAAPFEQFSPTQPVDVVLSFANHSTFDGNTQQDLTAYFERCAACLGPSGIFYFESHHPAFEGGKLEQVVGTLGRFFAVEERQVLRYGTYLDSGRTFIVAARR